MPNGPKFLRFFWPHIESLRELGGSATAREVIDLSCEKLKIPDDELAVQLKSGALQVVNQGYWAGQYLKWAGFIDPSDRRKWTLTNSGWGIDLAEQSAKSAYDLFVRIHPEHTKVGRVQTTAPAEPEGIDQPGDSSELIDDDDPDLMIATDLRRRILDLTPSGFEKLCKRVLTELGLDKLRVVGGAGDKGIDIEGLLRVSPVVSFRVGVQCKRYADGNKVVPGQIQAFQGALGPFDRGIFMTTSVFTKQAEAAATAPGSKPVDLVDGDRLVQLLREKGLGISTLTVVDENFFEPFS